MAVRRGARHVRPLVSNIVVLYCIYRLLPVDSKCYVKPSKIQRYLAILCDSSTTSGQVPAGNLAKLRFVLHLQTSGAAKYRCQGDECLRANGFPHKGLLRRINE